MIASYRSSGRSNKADGGGEEVPSAFGLSQHKMQYWRVDSIVSSMTTVSSSTQNQNASGTNDGAGSYEVDFKTP
jgi:hypothetical protein